MLFILIKVFVICLTLAMPFAMSYDVTVSAIGKVLFAVGNGIPAFEFESFTVISILDSTYFVMWNWNLKSSSFGQLWKQHQKC